MIPPDYPEIGWYVGDKLIHTPFAYSRIEYWVYHFESMFPDKAKRMREYSDKKGWSYPLHERYWCGVIIDWLQKNYNTACAE